MIPPASRRADRWILVVVWTCFLFPACNSDEAAQLELEVADVAELEDAPGSPLGDIGAFAVASDGDYLIGDRLVPIVRRFGSDGRLLAEFGQYGDGPFEFQQIGGIIEDDAGNVVVFDPRLRRATVLSAGLVPDTSFPLSPRIAGPVVASPAGYVVKTVPGRRTTGFTLMNNAWHPVWSLPSPVSSDMTQRPYWGGYAITRLASSSELIVIAYSFLYPFYAYGHRGEALGEFGNPPPSFRPASVLDPGALSGPGSHEIRERWLSSFDIIGNISIVADSLLAVTHGTLRPVGTSGHVVETHRLLDVYRLSSRTKIAEDLPLPDGVKVLAGGATGLWGIARGPPDPWTIYLLEIVAVDLS